MSNDSSAPDIRILQAMHDDLQSLTMTDTTKAVVLNFKALQLLRIKELQRKLFDLQMALEFGAHPPHKYDNIREELDGTLMMYGKKTYSGYRETAGQGYGELTSHQGNALKNYDFLSKDSLDRIPKGSKLFGQPPNLKEKVFGSHSQDSPKLGLKRGGHERREFELVDWQKYVIPRASTANGLTAGGAWYLTKSLRYRELDPYGKESRARHAAFLERISMALFGGLSLIVPMLVMALYPSLATSLVTTSIATVFFALVLARLATDSSGKDVLGITAAYAAVLVVFVGTGTSPS